MTLRPQHAGLRAGRLPPSPTFRPRVGLHRGSRRFRGSATDSRYVRISTMSEADTPHQHRRTPMLARDPEESNRASTPLELLFDLTIVVAFAQAASLMAQLLSEGHIGSAILGFVFAVFAICWAWVNYSWLASAFDNDDWLFRLATMVQMVGVLI